MGLLCHAQEQITEFISCIIGILTDTWAASVSIVYIYVALMTHRNEFGIGMNKFELGTIMAKLVPTN